MVINTSPWDPGEKEGGQGMEEPDIAFVFNY